MEEYVQKSFKGQYKQCISFLLFKNETLKNFGYHISNTCPLQKI